MLRSRLMVFPTSWRGAGRRLGMPGGRPGPGLAGFGARAGWAVAARRFRNHQIRGQGSESPGPRRGSTLIGLHGIGPAGAARLLVDVGDIHLFADRDRSASWNGTAPLDASSRNQHRHRRSRAGNRRINRTPAHHGRGPAAQPHPRPGLLRHQVGRRENADGGHPSPQTATVQPGLHRHGARPEAPAGDGPGRHSGTTLQSSVDQPDPGHRRFGQATSRTRHQPP
jgi:hypothetical protein